MKEIENSKKFCSKCKQVKSKEAFWKNKNKKNKDGLCKWCIECYNNFRRKPHICLLCNTKFKVEFQYASKLFCFSCLTKININNEKFCSKCKQVKSKEAFWKNKKNKDGLSKWCIECSKKSKIIIYHCLICGNIMNKGDRNKDNICSFCQRRLERNKLKFCKNCSETKSQKEFYVNSKNKDGLQPICKACYTKEEIIDEWLEKEIEKQNSKIHKIEYEEELPKHLCYLDEIDFNTNKIKKRS